MAIDERDLADFAERVADLGPIRYKRMFGGAGFWFDGKMFACYAEGSFMLRADEENAPKFAAYGIGPWVPGIIPSRVGKNITMPYYAIPDDVMGDDGLLLQWSREAIDAADRAERAKLAKKRK